MGDANTTRARVMTTSLEGRMQAATLLLVEVASSSMRLSVIALPSSARSSGDSFNASSSRESMPAMAAL